MKFTGFKISFNVELVAKLVFQVPSKFLAGDLKKDLQLEREFELEMKMGLIDLAFGKIE